MNAFDIFSFLGISSLHAIHCVLVSLIGLQTCVQIIYARQNTKSQNSQVEDKGLSIVDLTGMGVQDLAIARQVYESA